MKQTLRDLEIKNTRDAEAISNYKKQIAQLAACIQDREGRIRRRLPVIQKLNDREVSAFQAEVTRAKARGNMVEGTEYHTTQGKTVLHNLDGTYTLFTNGFPEFASKNLEVLSEMFFISHPEAKVFLLADDK